MFERFVIRKQAAHAMDGGRLETALRLLATPRVQKSRAAKRQLRKLHRALVKRADARCVAGRWSDVAADVELLSQTEALLLGVDREGSAAQVEPSPDRQRIEEALAAAPRHEPQSQQHADSEVGRAHLACRAGDLATAKAVLDADASGVGPHERSELLARIERQVVAARETLDKAIEATCPQETLALLVEARNTDCALAEDSRFVTRSIDVFQTRWQAWEAEWLAAAPMFTNTSATTSIDEARFDVLDRGLHLLADVPEGWSSDWLPAAWESHREELHQSVVHRLREQATPDLLCECIGTLPGRLLHREFLADWRSVVRTLRDAETEIACGRVQAARDTYREAARMLQGLNKDLAATVGRLAEASMDAEPGSKESIEAARHAIAEQRFSDARAILQRVLAASPVHVEARRELSILEQAVADQEERLAAARRLAAEGRLTEAAAVATSLAGVDPAGSAAVLLAEIRSRIEIVDRGLDQIRASLHKREAATLAGVRHGLQRVEQLAAVQKDHPEIQSLAAALRAEARALESLDTVRDLRDHGTASAAVKNAGQQDRDAEKLATVLSSLIELRPQLLREDRLDARILELADSLALHAENALREGRPTAVESWVRALSVVADLAPSLRHRIDDLQARVLERRKEASQTARQGLAALELRRIDAARECLQAALAADPEVDEVARLAEALQTIERHQAAMDAAAECVAESDFEGAQRKLDKLPPTPSALRTQVFDFKRGLAEAQGLEQGFLLRVDEGGEWLVLRSDSVVIGNVRDRRSDLPVLANLAGRHARIERTMSFHGGMKDQVVAMDGEVSVDGRQRQKHELIHGDAVVLGSSFELRYRMPSSRSLTASVSIAGGFQVQNTDKLLFLKDRGRDGRILIGSAADSHVRVRHADCEVELYGGSDGQMRVRCVEPGTIDGVPFQGEHPVAAGAHVQVGGIAFVMVPWRR